ncbi:MAG TPA: steroid 3-ketoacyl-CoA thiolase [Acidimicrobiales bacterium]
MNEVVIVEAVRTPIGKRNGVLANVHAADLLGMTLLELVARSGIDAAEVDQVLAGCVAQAGEQSFDIARTAWLGAGLPIEVPGSTIDAQCGSSQQAFNLAASAVAAGAAEVVVACGVELMSRVQLNDAIRGPGRPFAKSYLSRYEPTTQFEGADRIARRWAVTREDCDELGLRSQQRARRAWNDGRFDREVMAVEVPGDSGSHVSGRDEGLRDTSLEALARLTPVSKPEGVHTAGTSSQIADGAAAALLTTRKAAERLGLRPRAVVRHQTLVGSDPELMLTGPIPATTALLKRSGMEIDDFDVIEINEAFASVVLAWQREFEPNPDRVNPNGGAIALGHPLGCTGVRLVTTALHELERTGGGRALITMCCGGGLGTGTIIEAPS